MAHQTHEADNRHLASQSRGFPDGFYVSLYLTPVGIARTLKIWLRHDSSVALWRKMGKDVILVRYWELERLTGLKEHGLGFRNEEEQTRFLTELLESEGVAFEQVLDFWGSPDIGHRLWSPPPNSLNLAKHSLAHAYSALCANTPYLRDRPALVMAVDGGPDDVLETSIPQAWYAAAYMRPEFSEPRWLAIESPGFLYHWARKEFGMREGSLMALSSATHDTAPFDVATIMADCTFFGQEAEDSARLIFQRIMACTASAGITGDADGFSEQERRISAAMKMVDAASISIMERNINYSIEKLGVQPTESALALAGGSALNCPINTRLLDAYDFTTLLTVPCVNDSGQALGIGLWAFATLFGGPHQFSFDLQHPFYGPDVRATERIATNGTLPTFAQPFDAGTFVNDIEQGPLAWIEGAAEIGPRALGHRSILGDPRSVATRDAMNEIKRRQWWRPVAPVVIRGSAPEWFDLDRDSPYMLEAPKVWPHVASQIPAVIHLDGSARVQTIGSDTPGLIVQAVTAFHTATGVPVLCNTSLNDAGEPIIDSLGRAIEFCVSKGISVCYADGVRLDVPRAAASGLSFGHSRPFASRFDEGVSTSSPELNPHMLDPITLFTWLRSPTLRSTIDIRDGHSAAWLKQIVDEVVKKDPVRLDSVTQKLRMREGLW